ncbi:MAG: hypothetical protein GC134_04740 [Proteobacteria bacterium]|nr:hypothetical protein [Pseudomonadota bacterium]
MDTAFIFVMPVLILVASGFFCHMLLWKGRHHLPVDISGVAAFLIAGHLVGWTWLACVVYASVFAHSAFEGLPYFFATLPYFAGALFAVMGGSMLLTCRKYRTWSGAFSGVAMITFGTLFISFAA